MTVSQRFKTFLDNIRIPSQQAEDERTKHAAVRQCLNSHYWNSTSETANSLLVGSAAKSTRIRPPRDVDVMFFLPDTAYHRLNRCEGDKHPQLLHEVKTVLEQTYSTVRMRDDGQAIVISFGSYGVQVIPAFELTTGQYWICQAGPSGSYKAVDPIAEQKKLVDSATASCGNTRHLVKMMKKWQEHCCAAMKSFWIELLAIDFISDWEYRGKPAAYYDWMIRDFFTFVIGKANRYLIVPGTYEYIALGNAWIAAAEAARNSAVQACNFEREGKSTSARVEWQKIFGPDIP
jgi:hypothetical protein